MYQNSQTIIPLQDPLEAILGYSGRSVLAVLSRTEGPSYRSVGAMMAFHEPCHSILNSSHKMEKTGHLSSGCVEADLALHAREVLSSGQPATIAYGAGSPFLDIQLPCGGGMEVTLLPNADRAILEQILNARNERSPISLDIDLTSGALAVGHHDQTNRTENYLTIAFVPAPRFVIIGAGAEAVTFTALVHSADYDYSLLSPCPDTLSLCPEKTTRSHHLNQIRLPDDLKIDPWTAIVLFFHNHDWEPPILDQCLKSPAFYIGAQGSRKAAQARLEALKKLGNEDRDLDRIKGPIGLIHSARDPKTLAISVLSEVLATKA